MIWVTGDKHGRLESFEENTAYKKLSKKDTVIVCGDFGFIWNDSAQEHRKLKWLSKRKYNIAFIDGCHENFTRLLEYPQEEWNHGKVRRISSNIVWMLRGESYQIDDKKILTFGGGCTKRYEQENAGISWWPEELPTERQVDNAVSSIRQSDGCFDLIVSHEPPRSIKACMDNCLGEFESIHDILEEIRTHTNFKQWCFGKYHVDKPIPPNYFAVFEKLIPIK